MKNIHDRDVTCSAFSRELCLIVTGSADFTIRLFDFQSLNILACLTGHNAEIVDVCIVPEYALIISVDCDGYMLIWRYANYKYKLLQVIPNFIHEVDNNLSNLNNNNNNNQEENNLNNIERTSVSSKDSQSTFITSVPNSFSQSTKYETFPFSKVCAAFDVSKHQNYIITGDDKGFIRFWDLTKLIENRRLKPLLESDYLCNKTSYTSRRRNFGTCNKNEALVYQTPYLFLTKEEIEAHQKEIEVIMRRFNPAQNLLFTFKSHKELITLLNYNPSIFYYIFKKVIHL